MKAMISGQAGLVVVIDDAPVAHPISGGSAIRDPYTIARRFDGCEDVEIVEVDTLAEAQERGAALRETGRAAVLKILERAVVNADSQAIASRIPKQNPIAPKAAPRSDPLEQDVVVHRIPSKRAVAQVVDDLFLTRRHNRNWVAAYVKNAGLQKKGKKPAATVARVSRRGGHFANGAGSLLAVQGRTVLAAWDESPAIGKREIEVALLTERINQLTAHYGQAKRPRGRGLARLMSERRSLLDYLKSKDEDRYLSLIEHLGIRR